MNAARQSSTGTASIASIRRRTTATPMTRNSSQAEITSNSCQRSRRSVEIQKIFACQLNQSNDAAVGESLRSRTIGISGSASARQARPANQPALTMLSLFR